MSVGALSRSVSSMHSVVSTLSRSTLSTSTFTHAHEVVKGGDQDQENTRGREQTSVLPYLSPPTTVHEDEGQELDIPSYPYEFEPPTLTEQGHSLHGHGGNEPAPPCPYAPSEDTLRAPVRSPSPHVSGPAPWQPPHHPCSMQSTRLRGSINRPGISTRGATSPHRSLHPL
jgi:hypothetical protein